MAQKQILYFQLLCVVSILAASPVTAERHRADLNVRTQDGQSTFHIGERIPLKLTFSSPNDFEYLVAFLVPGRGFEVDCNQMAVLSPATGWSDPLEMYFKQDELETTNGWHWPHLKKSKPVEFSVDLNEWIRFDEPGVYTVKISSYCVARSHGSGGYLLTKTISLTIEPATPEWQNEKFKAIRDGLDLIDQPDPSGGFDRSQWEQRGKKLANARADLQYLATPAAIEELTYLLRDEKYNLADQCSFGLMGLPPSMRDTAIASMTRRIEEPDFPINHWFFDTFAFLHLTSGSDEESIRKQRKAIDPVIWTEIFSAIPRKDPPARAQTVDTLLNFRITSNPEIMREMDKLRK